ncbi:MAG: lycopene cyclase family protein [Rhodobacteraceae bacterium]|nr:lycopene cyclase family protein [Paracoccaceae bacterium]
MTKPEAEVAVLGAGPAGCIAARQLGLAGLDVILIDAVAEFASHQIESFPASGAPLLDDIGLLSLVCEVSDGPAAAMHMSWRETPELRSYEGDGPLLLRRERMHNSLHTEAARHVRVLPTRVRKVDEDRNNVLVVTDAGTIKCAMVVDARGRNAVKRPSTDIVALPFCAESAVASHRMWLNALPCGWLWASSLAAGQVYGALFQQAAALAGATPQMRLEYARRQLAQTQVFPKPSSVSVGKPIAAGLSAVADPIVSSRHILIGDAALARDPIASHGLVHAIRSGVQAAVAVKTILDNDRTSDPAYAFLRHKHAETVAAARQATSRAYSDQSRYSGSFWELFKPLSENSKMEMPSGGVLALASPLTRAPVLDTDCIRWAPALEMPAVNGFFTGQGSLTALDIAAACRPSASLPTIAERLIQAHPVRLVMDVLEHLLLNGAFVQTPLPVPSSARARRTSQPSSSEDIRDNAS